MAENFNEILRRFCLDDKVKTAKRITVGNINGTYRATTDKADYIVQNINTSIFKKPQALMSNVLNVTEYISAAKPSGVNLTFFRTEDGRGCAEINGEYWRICNYIPSVSFDSGDSLDIVNKAGKAFGDFQNSLAEFDASRLYETIPHFNEAKCRFDALRRAADNDVCGRMRECERLVDGLLRLEDDACILDRLLSHGELPLRVTHNDTKINNVLFDRETLEPLAVVDLDTVMPGVVGYDFGDGIRSAANSLGEESENIDGVCLDTDKFYAFADGFLSRTAGSLTETEAETLADSCLVFICKQAVRFLSDYIDGDVYFKPKKERHNIIRAENQYAMLKSAYTHSDFMRKTCHELYKKYR